MFGRQKVKFKSEVALFDCHIKLNEQRVCNWIDSVKEIGCETKWEANDSNFINHIITYMPKAGVYFHRTPGVFSESVAGKYRTRDDIDVEWGLQGEHFIVRLPIANKKIFCCPLSRAGLMMSRGDNGASDPKGESNLIDIRLNDASQQSVCRRVLETIWDTYSLNYSNDLVKVRFEIAPKNKVLHYDNYVLVP